jgi:hypothetical protein
MHKCHFLLLQICQRKLLKANHNIRCNSNVKTEVVTNMSKKTFESKSQLADGANPAAFSCYKYVKENF